MSCIPASTLSNAPLYPAKVFNNVSVGALSGNSEPGTSCVDACVAAFLAMISLTELHAFIADEHAWSRDQRLHLRLRFPAKRAAIYALVSLGSFLFWHGLSSVVNVRMTVNYTLTPMSTRH
jgi:hypothetical protein